MDNTELLNTFTRTMKATLETGALYSLEHPIFSENLERLKECLESFLKNGDPLKIGFSPHSLIIDDIPYSENDSFKRLAHSFYKKKVKAITFRPGLTDEELKEFIATASLQARDLFAAGGMSSILQQKNIAHITVNELDFTELLNGEGEECADVWTYMLREAVTSQNKATINKYAENFGKLAKRIKMTALIEDPQAYENMQTFLSFLQETEEAKYKDCAKHLLKSAVKTNAISDEESIRNISALVKNLKTDDLADALWDEIISEDHVDTLNLNLFSQLMDTEENRKVTDSLAEKAEKNKLLLKAPRVRKRINDLFSDSNASFIPENYRHFLNLALNTISDGGILAYDRHHAEKNYWLIVCALVPFEKDASQSEKILQRMQERWDQIKETNNIKLLLAAYGSLQSLPRIDDEKVALYAKGLRQIVTEHVEAMIFDGEISITHFSDAIRVLAQETHAIERYYDMFFNHSKVNPFMLQLLLSLPRDNPHVFYQHLSMKKKDVKFIRKIIDLAKHLPSTQESLDVLTTIYNFSGEFIKIKALREMAAIGLCDEQIVLPLLKKSAYHVKLEALRVALGDKEVLHKALHILFWIPPLFGINTYMLCSHIKIVDTLDIHDAQHDIERLASLKYFWNSAIRRDAKKLLEKWTDE